MVREVVAHFFVTFICMIRSTRTLECHIHLKSRSLGGGQY